LKFRNFGQFYYSPRIFRNRTGSINYIIILRFYIYYISEVKSSKDDAYPSQSDGQAFIAGQIKWCILSDLSARVCADQLVHNLEHHFGGDWGCMVTKPAYGYVIGYYYHWDDGLKYKAICYPDTSTAVKKDDLIYMCRNAEHACVGESSVQTCMLDLLKKTPTFCPDKYTLHVAKSYQETAFDHLTAKYGYTAKGGDYECSVACHGFPTGWVKSSAIVLNTFS